MYAFDLTQLFTIYIKCNKKQVETSATLVVTGALLVVTSSNTKLLILTYTMYIQSVLLRPFSRDIAIKLPCKVVFAAIRIVTALFLKETLSTAANDAELVIEDSRRTAVQYQKKLEELFRLVDDDGATVLRQV